MNDERQAKMLRLCKTMGKFASGFWRAKVNRIFFCKNHYSLENKSCTYSEKKKEKRVIK